MPDDLTFTFTDEQQELRRTARRFLADRSGHDKVRRDMETDEGFDPDLWAEVAEMGWASLAIPEEYGGAGYGWNEVSVLMEEMGRTLACLPYLSSAVLSVAALLHAGSDPQKKELLAPIATGELRATVAHLIDRNAVTVTDGALTGEASFVLDGHTADRLLVPARHEGGPVSLFLVDGRAEGLDRRVQDVLDQTRPMATLVLDRVAGERLGDPGTGADTLDRVVTVGAVMLAAEQVGGAQQVLDASTTYARTRKQFGRAIGSFQAIKHRLAETLIRVENARSLAYHAARVLAAGDEDELPIAAAMAASLCSEVYEQAAGDNIQNHGGIGFTWEHEAHLYFKRAKADKLLFGDPVRWRRRLADTLGF